MGPMICPFCFHALSYSMADDAEGWDRLVEWMREIREAEEKENEHSGDLRVQH